MAAVDNKMIEVSVRFTTDGLSETDGQVLPKHGWTVGFVNVRANSRHGIASNNPVPFNSLAELPGVIERVLTQQGVKLHLSPKMRKLYKS